jgi:hypothetical protein
MRHPRFASIRSTITALVTAALIAALSAATVLADSTGGGPLPK